MRLYFVRHGESEANRLREFSNHGLKHPLTPEGRQQVAALAEKLREKNLSRILSSPLLRALETSVLLSSALNVPYAVEPRLREIDEGELEGCSDEVSWARWRERNERWWAGETEVRMPRGESLLEARKRLSGLLFDLHGQPSADMLLVTHGLLLMMALWPFCTGLHPLSEHAPTPGHTDLIVLELQGSRWKALSWGDLVTPS